MPDWRTRQYRSSPLRWTEPNWVDRGPVGKFAFVSGDAYNTLKEYWDLQSSGDYKRMLGLFAPDAVVVDPIHGNIVGLDAISELMTKVLREVKRIGASFTLEELSGDDEVAWAQWVATTDKGERRGVGVYKVRDGRITYYRDYMNAARFDGRR